MTYGDEADRRYEAMVEHREERLAELARETRSCCRFGNEWCVHALAREVKKERERCFRRGCENTETKA